jgi:hypothetical protein
MGWIIICSLCSADCRALVLCLAEMSVSVVILQLAHVGNSDGKNGASQPFQSPWHLAASEMAAVGNNWGCFHLLIFISTLESAPRQQQQQHEDWRDVFHRAACNLNIRSSRPIHERALGLGLVDAGADASHQRDSTLSVRYRRTSVAALPPGC